MPCRLEARREVWRRSTWARTNSDGWIEPKPKEYHRTAPCPKSVPKAGSKATAATAQKNPSTPKRRIAMGDIIDTRIITVKARPP